MRAGVTGPGADPDRATVKLLGRPRLFMGGQWRPLPSGRRGQLLSYLAVQDEWVARDRMADLLWHDLTMPDALRNLRHLVHTIGRRAPVPGLEIAREALRWSVDSDVGRFRRAISAGALEDALGLYAGPLLDGFDGRADGTFGAWLDAEREDLRRRHLDAAVALVRSEAVAGRPERAAALAMSLLDGHDVDEERALLAVRALQDAGSTQLARAALERYVGTLGRELGTAPGREILGLLAALAAPATPTQAHREILLGRARELDRIDGWFASGDRLVTLLGPPGIGKSALARTASQRCADRGGRAAFIAIAGAPDLRTTASRLARGLGGLIDEREQPERAVAALAESYDLIVLDDVEATAAMAPLVTAVLRSPRPCVLVVATEPLRVATERVLHLQGLQYGSGTDGGQVDAPPAAELFVSLARRRDPAFEVDPERMDLVRRIVAAVEGSPLAIELAAAWVGTLSLDEIERRVAAEPDFLTEPARWAPARHRSLRGAYAHAIRLLGDEERSALQRLAVFSSSFSLDAARSVGRVSPPIVAQLVDRALLRREGDDRYALPNPLRPFVREALQGDPRAEDEACLALMRFGVAFARHGLGDDAIVTPHAVAALDREQHLLVASFAIAAARSAWDAVDDLTRGLAAWFDVRGRHGDALRLFAMHLGARGAAATTPRPWLRRAWLRHWHDPEASIREVLELQQVGGIDDPLDRIAAERILGTSAWRLSRHDEGRHHLERGLALARHAGHDGWCAVLLDGLGLCLAARGSYAVAERAQREALVLNERLGTGYQMVQNLINLASHAQRRADERASVGHAQRAVELADAIGYLPYLAHARTQLAISLLAAGRHTEAFTAAQEAAAGAHRHGDGYVRIWSALVLASAADAAGRPDAPQLLVTGLRSASAAGDTKQLTRGLLTAMQFAVRREAFDLAALLAVAIEAAPGAATSSRREATGVLRSLTSERGIGTTRALRRRGHQLGLPGVEHEFEAAVAAWSLGGANAEAARRP
jgi:DNA-binding SARP family transcriptional activator/tetratricopeptide (TPR) repeat protein